MVGLGVGSQVGRGQPGIKLLLLVHNPASAIPRGGNGIAQIPLAQNPLHTGLRRS